MKILNFVLPAFVILALGVFMFVSGCNDDQPAAGHHGHDGAAQAEGIEQTHCPVMGSAIDPDISIEYQGQTVYFCCPPCVDAFEADPEQYVDNLPQFN